MKLVKAVGTPCEIQYDSRTFIEVPIEGVLLPDKIAWALAERRNVTVEDAPDATSKEADLEIPLAHPIPDVAKEISPEPGLEMATPTVEELISMKSPEENV